MIDLYYSTTPNGKKITIFLEEAGLPYTIKPIHISKGDQFTPEFLSISPNNKIPAIVDHDGPDGKPISVFESGAILHYLGQKTGKFWPSDLRKQTAVMEWLMWQMGGFGPMLGQNHHFNRYAPVDLPYAKERYTNETTRLYQVLNTRLEGRDFICDEYSIADMATYAWAYSYEWHMMKIEDFPNVERWFHALSERPAVKAGMAVPMPEREDVQEATAEMKAKIFGVSAYLDESTKA